MQTSHFGTYEGQPVTLYTLKNKNGMTAKIMDYGATIVTLTAPDRKGKYEDVTLGFDTFDPYPTKSPYFGCIVGRVGNRQRASQARDERNHDFTDLAHGGSDRNRRKHPR